MTKNFRKILFTAFTFLTVFILVFAFLNFGLKTKIKEITVNGGTQSAEINNQIINIKFSHPANKKYIENHITVDPVSPFLLNWTDSKSLQVKFRESLNTNTDYNLNIKSDNKNLNEDFNFKFKTKTLKLIYIEKSEGETVNRIVQTDENFEKKEVLFEKENIVLFSKNKNFLSLVTRNPNRTNNLFLIDLKTRESKQIDLPASLISSISMSPVKDEFLFTRSDALQKGNDVIPSQEYSLNIYNIKKKEYKKINPENTAIYIREAYYSPDGTAILYQTDANLYYLVDTESYSKLVAVGKHDSSGGFNSEKNKILFNDLSGFNPSIFIYNTNRQIQNLELEKVYPVDPSFLNNFDDVIYSQKIDLENPASFLYEIKRTDILKKQSKSVLKQEGKSLENAKISPDDKYLVIERFDTKRQINPKDFRVTGFQLKPGNAELIIYDLKNEKVIDKAVRGINAVWEVE